MAEVHTKGTCPISFKGFSEPVFDSQKVFRAVMMALAYPGKAQWIGKSPEESMGLPTMPGLHSASLAWLLALADVDTPIWLEERLRDRELASYLRFHTGAEVTTERQHASFGLFSAGYCGEYFADFPLGTDACPELSATLLIQVHSFTSGVPRIIAGPGIATTQVLRINGLPETFWKEWHANQALYPCGIDVLLTAGDQIMGLPRSTSIEGV